MSVDTDSPCPAHPAYPAGVCPLVHDDAEAAAAAAAFIALTDADVSNLMAAALACHRLIVDGGPPVNR